VLLTTCHGVQAPGLVFAGYMAFYKRSKLMLGLWCPAMIWICIGAAVLFEVRLLIGFVAGV
jgi:hypothetical protein